MPEYQYPHARIAIFAKAPVAGRVKTRMQPVLSEQQSAYLQAQLIDRSIDTALDSRVAPVQLWCAPDTQHAAFRQHANKVALQQQQGQDLGQRMQAAFIANQHCDFTLLIGTDCPLLSVQDMRNAALAVQTNTVCIAPAHDGGYVLIASGQTPACFEKIHWGTDQVLRQSLSALADAGQKVQLLAALPDLDHPADLAKLPEDIIQQLALGKLRQQVST